MALLPTLFTTCDGAWAGGSHNGSFESKRTRCSFLSNDWGNKRRGRTYASQVVADVKRTARCPTRRHPRYGAKEFTRQRSWRSGQTAARNSTEKAASEYKVIFHCRHRPSRNRATEGTSIWCGQHVCWRREHRWQGCAQGAAADDGKAQLWLTMDAVGCGRGAC